MTDIATTVVDRSIAGLRCSEVLAALSDYLDGDLAAAPRAAFEAHVSACPDCARFGARMSSVVAALRQPLGAASDDVPPDVAAALAARLADRDPG